MSPNQDLPGKPSERIKSVCEMLFNPNPECIPNIDDVRREMDALHQRLLAAEEGLDQVKNDYCVVMNYFEPMQEPQSPAPCDGKHEYIQYHDGRRGFYCRKCYPNGVDLPEPAQGGKLATLLRDRTVWTFVDYQKASVPMWESTARAAIEAVERVIDEFRNETQGGFFNWEQLNKKLRELL